MKKIISLFTVLICIISLTGCGSSVDNAKIEYGQSKLYSKQDIDSAIAVIKDEFASWEGCVLHSLTYAGDDICVDELDYCKELKENNDFTECMVFNSSFHSPIFGGGAWNANEEYTWSWYLAREDAGDWELLTWGYG